MRRKDAQVTDVEKIKDILRNCEICRLGLSDGLYPYVVPVNFGFEINEEKLCLYFHGSKVGRKGDLIKKSPFAGFEMDANHSINTAEKPCDFSYKYQSIIGHGDVKPLTETKEKYRALSLIMSHYEERDSWQFDEKMLNATAVFKLEVLDYECKVRG